MLTKRAVIVLLVGINLLLLATLILSSYRLPAAYAQATPLGQNYLMVAAQVRNGTDAVYVIDLPHRRMHVFLPNQDQTNRRLFYQTYRDLQRDFRGAP